MLKTIVMKNLFQNRTFQRRWCRFIGYSINFDFFFFAQIALVRCEYLASDGVLVSGALLQDGFERREGFRRAPCVARLSVDVRNLELHRREDVSDVLLRLDASTNDRNVMLLPQSGSTRWCFLVEARRCVTFWYATCVVQVSWPGLALTRPLVLSEEPLPWK